jgi:hypothetical protein
VTGGSNRTSSYGTQSLNKFLSIPPTECCPSGDDGDDDDDDDHHHHHHDHQKAYRQLKPARGRRLKYTKPKDINKN